MTTLYFCLGGAAFLLLWLVWRTKVKVYAGEASVHPRNKHMGQYGHAFVEVFVPRCGFVTAEISVERFKKLPYDVWQIPVEVVVKQHFLGLPWVESIKWPDSDKPEVSVKPGDGSYVAVAFLFAAIFAIGLKAGYASMLMLMVSGFVLGAFINAGDKPLPRATMIGLAVATPILGIASLVLFYEIGLWTLLPGLVVAFGCGQCAGMLKRWRAKGA